MGLFDFLKGNKEENNLPPLSDYLEKVPSWYLMQEVQNIMCPYVYVADIGRPIRLQKYEFMSSFMMPSSFSELGIEFPKKYKKGTVYMTDLLEAAAKQHEEDRAAFMLFLMYDNGLHKLTPDGDYVEEHREELRDEEKAIVWRARARECNSVYEEAYTYIEENSKVKNGLPIHNIELFALEMLTCTDEKVKAILGSRGKIEAFNKIGMYLMCGLFQMGFAYAMGYLTDLLNRTNGQENKTYHYPALELFKFVSEEKIDEACVWTAKNLLSRAKFADEAADYVMKKFKFEVENVYNF